MSERALLQLEVELPEEYEDAETAAKETLYSAPAFDCIDDDMIERLVFVGVKTDL